VLRPSAVKVGGSTRWTERTFPPSGVEHNPRMRSAQQIEHNPRMRSARQKLGRLSTLATDPSGQLDVLGHDGHPLGVDSAQVGVLKQANQVGLAGLLESSNGSGLEPEVSLEVLGNLPDKTLERELADEELGGLLVPPDLPEGDCARPVSVRLLHASCGGR